MFITLLLVPVFYAICVLDLKIVKWDSIAPATHSSSPAVHVEHVKQAAVGHAQEG